MLGADFRANAVEIAAEREGVTVEGFAALPTLTRANALGQYLFVNGRPVRDKLLLGAVRAAYADYLPRDRHPLLALFVTLDPREVDVNVHPAKTEVRFRNAGLVRALIVHALKAALTREGTRAATTGGSATIAAFPPGGIVVAPDGRGGTGGVRRRGPAIRAAQVLSAGGGFAEAAQAAFDVGAPAVGVETSLAGIARSVDGALRRLRRSASSIRSAPRARKCTRPISWRKRATGSSSSISMPRMSASSTRG